MIIIMYVIVSAWTFLPYEIAKNNAFLPMGQYVLHSIVWNKFTLSV